LLENNYFKIDKMSSKKINLKQKFSKFTEYWSPKIIAQMNDYQFKVVKIKGEFTWHNHTDTDETFLVIEGEMFIEFKDHEVKLSKGEMYVVPKGVEHKPHAEKECKILIIEPKGVINTGDAGGDLTVDKETWI
tara:strand:- start:10624 stop:11022 length:399 start_codon:yes stop_codon:yes gene_type:complete